MTSLNELNASDNAAVPAAKSNETVRHAPPPARATSRPAYTLLAGYMVSCIVAALADRGVLETALTDGKLTLADFGARRALAQDTAAYLCDRGLFTPADDSNCDYLLTDYGRAVLKDYGFIYWIAGGFGEPFLRYRELLEGAATYGVDVSRDGRKVAVSSAILGRDDLKPYVESVVQGLAPSKILDLGCGNARNLLEFLRLTGAAGIGVDIDDAAIEAGRREVADAGAANLQIVQADASYAECLPGLESVDLVVAFFFLHEVMEKGYDHLTDYLTVMRTRLPVGAHVVAAEVVPPTRDRASEEVFTPEFTVTHALMNQHLLSYQGWTDVFLRSGFDVRIERPNIPGGAVIIATTL